MPTDERFTEEAWERATGRKYSLRAWQQETGYREFTLKGWTEFIRRLGRFASSDGAPAWLEALRAPSDDLPTAAADFVGGNYWNGEEVAVTSLLGNRAVAPLDTFNEASIGGSGLDCTPEQASVACPQGGLLAALQTNNWTVIIEWTHTGVQVASARSLLTALNNVNDGDEGFDLFAGNPAIVDDFLYFTDYNIGTANSVESVDAVATNRAAVTFTSGKMALSLNGAAVVSSVAPPLWNNDWLVYTIGKADGDGLALRGHIRKFAIYDPQPDADLPAMSGP